MDDFAEDKNLNSCVRSYHRLMNDYMSRRGHAAAIHTVQQYRGFYMAKMTKKQRVRQLLAANPQVDAVALSQVLKIIGSLRKNGIKGAGYNLSSPFGSRQQRKGQAA